MYFNNVHILYYVAIGIIGLFIGNFVGWMNKRLSEKKKVFDRKEFIKQNQKDFKPHYILMFTNSLIYVGLLYKFGIGETISSNIELVKFIILTPMILSALCIDYKLSIIPNRLVLTIFEIGLIFAFICGLTDINMAVNLLTGMIVGCGIFLVITLLGGLVAGKEAMGFGDVKLIGALGLYFGVSNIIAISLMSFLIGAIISIIILLTKSKKSNEYIPFGPFIVISAFIMMFIPFDTIMFILLKIFTLGLYKGKLTYIGE